MKNLLLHIHLKLISFKVNNTLKHLHYRSLSGIKKNNVTPLKMALLLVVFSIILTSCHQEDEITALTDLETQDGIYSIGIYPLESEHLQDLLFQVKDFSTPNGRLTSHDYENIDMDSAVMVVNDSLNLIRYSLLMSSENSIDFENLIIKEGNEGVNAYYIRYEPEISWFISNEGFEKETLTGTLRVLDLDRNEMIAVQFENGKGTVLYQNNALTNGKVNCSDNNNGEGDSQGGSGTSGGNDSDSRSGNDGIVGSGDGSGGIKCSWHVSSTTGGLVVVCDDELYFLRVSGCGSSGINISDGIGILPSDTPADIVEALADYWQSEKISLTDEFENDECLMSIWTAIQESDAGFNMIKDFLGEFPSAELIIDALNNYEDLYDNNMLGALGAARNFHQEQYVFLNMKELKGASFILIATILGHELIHASMYKEIYDNTHLIQDNGYNPEEVQRNLPLLFDLWRQYDIEVSTHNLMANKYRDVLVTFIKDLDITMNGRAVNKKKYQKLSWIGLKGTQAYKDAVDNGTIGSREITNLINNEKKAGKCN